MQQGGELLRNKGEVGYIKANSMYGPHHRVAPLRHGASRADNFSHSNCNQGQLRRYSHMANTLSYGAYDTPCTASTTEGVSSSYTLPASMQCSRLVASSHSQFVKQPTQTWLSDGSTVDRTTPSVNYQPPQRQQQHNLDVAEALQALTGAVEVQGKQMTEGCQSLIHLRAIAEGQGAQVAALNALTTEVRAMVEVIREACTLLPRETNKVEFPASAANRCQSHRHGCKRSELVLGEGCSSGASSNEAENDHRRKTNINRQGWRDGAEEAGAAHSRDATRSNGFKAQSSTDILTALRIKTGPRPQYAEDDIFLM